MPRPKTKRKTAKKVDFPTMFYREAPLEKIMANAARAAAPRPAATADLRKRQILMWGGVAVVMIFLITLWGMEIRKNFKNTGSVKQDLNFLNKGELSNILSNNQTKAAEMEKIKNIIVKESKNFYEKKLQTEPSKTGIQ